MSYLEKFGLFTGIVGVVADIVAIIGYLTGLFKFGSQDISINQNQAPTIFIITLAIIIVYSWIMLAWVLTKRRVLNLKTKSIKFDFDKIIKRSVVGIGLLIVPVILGWFVVTRLSTVGTPSTEIRNRAIMYATQTAQVFENPIYATKISATEAAGGEIVIPESVEALEYKSSYYDLPPGIGTYGFLFPVTCIGLGYIIYWVINLLMPVIYDNIFDDYLDTIKKR